MNWITLGFLAVLTTAGMGRAQAEDVRKPFVELRKAQTSVAAPKPDFHAAREQKKSAFQELRADRQTARGVGADDRKKIETDWASLRQQRLALAPQREAGKADAEKLKVDRAAGNRDALKNDRQKLRADRAALRTEREQLKPAREALKQERMAVVERRQQQRQIILGDRQKAETASQNLQALRQQAMAARRTVR